eukprot:jgi/Mesvir1/1375/Mv21648-RA.2
MKPAGRRPSSGVNPARPVQVQEADLGRNAEEEYLLALGELTLDDVTGGGKGLLASAPPGLQRNGNGASPATQQAVKLMLAQQQQQQWQQQQQQQPGGNRQQAALGQPASSSPVFNQEEGGEEGEEDAAPEGESGGGGGRSRKARQRRKAAAARQGPMNADSSAHPASPGHLSNGNSNSWTNGNSNKLDNNSSSNFSSDTTTNGTISANANGRGYPNLASNNHNRSSNGGPPGMHPAGGVNASSTTYSAPSRNGGQVSPMSLGLVTRVHMIAGYKCMDKNVNVLEGLMLFQQVLSEPQEQELIEWVFHQERLGQAGALMAATYSAPKKWMKGKGRIVLQYGSLYDYMEHRIDPETPVDPMPPILRNLVNVLVQAGVFQEGERPDTAIVNDYHEGDAIPPHIDYPRPFCTVSLLAETSMLMGRRIKVLGPGESIVCASSKVGHFARAGDGAWSATCADR